jgi:hypothetical protein
MNLRLDIFRNTLLSILLALLGACAPLEGNAKESDAISGWVEQYVNKDEKLLCQRAVEGDYFFIARIGDRVKVGSRLDVTGVGGTPKTFVISWQFQNEKDNHLVTNMPPSPVKEDYVKNDGKMYAEHIQYQTLHLSESQKMRVTVDLKKCANKDDCSMVSKGDKLHTIRICEVPLSKQ